MIDWALSAAARKIPVDGCDACPFEYDGCCTHPDRPPKEQRREALASPPPSWCPLYARDVLVVIEPEEAL